MFVEFIQFQFQMVRFKDMQNEYNSPQNQSFNSKWCDLKQPGEVLKVKGVQFQFQMVRFKAK